MSDAAAIRTLGEDEKITEPGFYAISLERHHGQPCDGPSVTSGVLRTMELETPADVWAFSLLNPDRWESTRSDALRIGGAMHAYVGGGEDELRAQYMVLPENKPNRPTAAQLNAISEGRGSEAAMKSVRFWDRVDRDPRDMITAAEWELITDMGRVLVKDPAAVAALGGIPEVSMAWFDDESQLWCLARPDNVHFDGLVSDYKTASPMGAFSHRYCDRQIVDKGYDMQLAFACEGFERLTHEWPPMAALVFQSKTRPHHVILREIEDEDLRLAQWRNRRARLAFRECLDSGIWPGPGADIAAFRRPDWQREMILDAMQTEGATTP